MTKPAKSILSLLLMLALLLSCPGPAGTADAAGGDLRHTTTLMVYMCGSDLESRFGFASRDLLEILSSGVDFDYTNVLVMVGGAKAWALGFPEEETAILELGPSGIRTVWHSGEPLDMADGGTLVRLLDCGYSRYPAERYALILWDHGGGPIEGVCYDELFPGNVMTLPVLRKALGTAGAASRDRRLSWIGFDACMMANLETCYLLRDYTDYLIASQEAEPSSGWDYAFLKGLESDADGAATGRRIIDAYFAQAGSGKDVLTLSCVDLRVVRELQNALDRFFGGMIPSLTDESFSELSRQRHRAPGFGRSEFNDSADYDLVDLLALAKVYGDGGSAQQRLEQALAKAVVFSRSSLDGASGLSVYHPCYNREKYEAKWEEEYASLFTSLSKNYVAFIKRYGRILTGERLGDWSGLETRRELDADGNIRFSVQLSEEQLEHLEHSSLLLIAQEYTDNSGLGGSYYKVWEAPCPEPGPDRTISLVCPGRAVYVVDDESGEILAGPLNCSVTRDGQLQVIVLYWDADGVLDDEKLMLRYECRLIEGSDRLEIERICAYDELTGDYSQRMTVDDGLLREREYTSAIFYILNRIKPDTGGELPGYRDWPSDGNGFMYSDVRLPRSWHLEAREIAGETETLCAAFQISDTQGQLHCSSLCRMFPDSVMLCDVSVEPTAEGLPLQAQAQYFTARDSVCLRIDVLDPPPDIYSYSAGEVLVNGSLLLKYLSAYSSDGTLFLTLPRGYMASEEALRTLDFQLSATLSDYSSYSRQQVHFDFPEPIRFKSPPVEPLSAVVSDDGLRWQIRNVEQNNGEFYVSFDVTNPTRQQKSFSLSDFAVGPFQMSAYGSADVPPGTSVFCRIRLSPAVYAYDEGLKRVASLQNPLRLLGMGEFDCLRLRYEERDGSPVLSRELYFPLHTPQPCTFPSDGEELPVLPVLDAEEADIVLSQCVLYRDSRYDRDTLSLGLWFRNKGDAGRQFLLDAFSVNGVRTANRSWTKTDSFFILGDSTEYHFLQVELPKGVETPERISFSVFLDGEYLADASALLPG